MQRPFCILHLNESSYSLREHWAIVPCSETIKNSEYDQEVPQSQTAENPMAPRGRDTQQSRDTRKTYKAEQPALSSPSR